MKKEFFGLKLLYLGGISRARFVVERAQRLGAYVIVADYNEDSPAKAIADESALISVVDVDAVTRLAEEKKINGIMTGYCDILMPVCLEVAKRLNLPCYYTEDILKAATDKGFFKAMCRRNGVPVPATYVVGVADMQTASHKLEYPVFIKPLDASGSRGANACYSAEEFVEKYNYALSYSKSKNVIVEELLSGIEFILDYVIINGEAHLLSMADRYVIDGRPEAINSPNIMVLPSRNLKLYMESVNPLVCEMFKKENFEDGLYFLQGYASEKKIAFYEMGSRLGGTWPYIDEHFHGLNPMDMLFRHALTGKMVSPSINVTINADFGGGMAAVLYFLSNKSSGCIKVVKGIKESQALPYVVHLMQYYFEGDSFDHDTQTDVRFLAIHLVADNYESLKVRIKAIYDMIDFVDETGESLLQPAFNMDTLIGY